MNAGITIRTDKIIFKIHFFQSHFPPKHIALRKNSYYRFRKNQLELRIICLNFVPININSMKSLNIKLK